MRRRVSGLTVAGLLALANLNPAAADVLLSGPTANAGSYSLAGLAAVATAGDTVTDGSLTGISLWGLLGGQPSSSPTSPTYGGITTITPAGDNGKNAILRYYLIGSNASGQQSVVSLGEIDPSFGGTAPTPAFVAFQNSANPLTAPELVVPGPTGTGTGRDLANLTSLTLLAVPALPNGPGGVSNSVQLSGAVNNPGAYTQAILQANFTPVTETVSSQLYTGVPLLTFINPSDGNTTSQIVITQATDGYEVVLSLAELDPTLGGNSADLLPYASNGSDFPGDGVARTILPADNKHGRWESNLDAVTVTEVPEPASIGVFVIGLAALGWSRVRRVLEPVGALPVTARR
jgi:hypothetical protein